MHTVNLSYKRNPSLRCFRVMARNYTSFYPARSFRLITAARFPQLTFFSFILFVISCWGDCVRHIRHSELKSGRISYEQFAK